LQVLDRDDTHLAVDGACGTAAVGALPSQGGASGAAIQIVRRKRQRS